MRRCIIPKSIVNDKNLSDEMFELLVMIIKKCNGNIYCSITIATMAKALRRKEETISKLIRRLEVIGYLSRFYRRLEPLRLTAFWVLNPSSIIAAIPGSELKVAVELQDKILSHHRLHMTRPKKIDLELNLAIAEESLDKFRHPDYGGDKTLIDLRKTINIANHNKLMTDIKMSNATGPEFSRLLRESDYHLNYSQLGEADFNQVKYDRHQKRKECIKALFDLRNKPLDVPEDLKFPHMAPGQFLRIPNRLFSSDAISRCGIPGAAASLRRFCLFLYAGAFGYQQQETTVKRLAKKFGRHPDTIGDYLRALEKISTIKLEYRISPKPIRKLQYNVIGGRATPSLITKMSDSRRITGVRITLCENHRKPITKGPTVDIDRIQYFPTAHPIKAI